MPAFVTSEAVESIITFLDMGGYAAFVWPAFAITAVVMILLLVASRRSLAARERALKALEEAETATAGDEEREDEA